MTLKMSLPTPGSLLSSGCVQMFLVACAVWGHLAAASGDAAEQVGRVLDVRRLVEL